jgi:hypothetical protein
MQFHYFMAEPNLTHVKRLISDVDINIYTNQTTVLDSLEPTELKIPTYLPTS